MKQTITTIVSSLALMLLAISCQQPDLGFSSSGPQVLTASLEGKPATKTHLSNPVDGVYYPFWTSRDALAVYVDGLSYPDKYTIFDGVGTDKGVFTGTVKGGSYVALYPYADLSEEGLRDNVLTLNLPAEQIFSEESFGEGAFPMLAVSHDQSLSFLNLCAVLKVSMTGETSVKAIRFRANDEKMAVSGKATVHTDFTSLPELVMASGGSPEVTLQCTSIFLDKDTPVDFFIVIPPGTYKGGFTLEVDTFSGSYTKTITSDVTFARSQFRYIAPFVCETNGEIDPDDLPYNQIWYVTDNGRILHLRDEGYFNSGIVSHTYENGKGVIVLDGPLTEVKQDAFYHSENLKEIKLPNSVEKIGVLAFAESGLEEFRVPDNLVSVGALAFNRCSNMTRFYGKHVSEDGRYIVLDDGTAVAYAGGAVTDPMYVPEGVKNLASQLFHDEKNLRNLILPEGVESIGDYCFFSCTNLETISLPASLKKVEKTAFENCSSLRALKGESPLIMEERCLVDNGELFFFAGSGITDFTVPEGVSALYNTAFRNNKTILSLTFPSSLNNLYNQSFYGCDNLEFFYGSQTTEDHHCLVFYGDFLVGVTHICPADYVIPDGYGITRIFMQVFQGITSIERLTMPDSVRETWGNTFCDMPNLRAVVVSAGMSSFGGNDFDNCPKLDTLYLRSFTPPSYYGSDLSHDGFVICVPEGSKDLYSSSGSWSQYAQYIQEYHYDDLEKPDYYMSADYSHDGEVTTLQRATEGRGIELVLMGDAFSDRQIADGTYAAVMDKMAEAFFSEEPYKSYRDMFNVSAVTVVSATEGYEHGGQALSGWFGSGTEVGGNNDKCMDYALRAVPEDRMDNTLIVVAMNSPAYGGTCYMYNPMTQGDYGSGTSVAYFPIGESDEGLAQLVHHEAGGHGFAKLADEYAYEDMGTIPESEKQARESNMPFGWWKNADFTSDPSEVKWARFLSDERYQYDGLGVFEGAFTYWKGAWRPTEYSIMRYNTGGFNAPSREAIWYRLHKLAYGAGWVYDYEAFVEYDAVNRKTSESSAAWSPMRRKSTSRPTHPPVMVGKTWRQAIKETPGRVRHDEKGRARHDGIQGHARRDVPVTTGYGPEPDYCRNTAEE